MRYRFLALFMKRAILREPLPVNYLLYFFYPLSFSKIKHGGLFTETFGGEGKIDDPGEEPYAA